MKPIYFATIWASLVLVLFTASRTDAEQFGLFTYEVAGGEITITGYPRGTVEDIVFPAMIEGKPVTTIGSGAFSFCSGLKSITIPDSVTTIGFGAFRGCSGMTSIAIPDSVTEIGWRAFSGCSGLTSASIPEGVTEIDRETFSGCSGLTSISIPESVTYVGREAFSGCSSLTSVTIPNSVADDGGIAPYAFSDCSGLTRVSISKGVTYIFYSAFRGCSRLTSVFFSGEAPSLEEPETVFPSASPNFTIYYLSSSEGFTSPTWHGYPTVMIDEEAYPAASWLLQHGLSYDADIQGDGLIMPYALNLDPNAWEHHLPRPVIDPVTGTLISLSFYAASPGITYQAQSSTDLQTWTTDGVAVSDLGEDDRRTALIQGPGDRFMRLVVETE